jgi:hypothetical protein
MKTEQAALTRGLVVLGKEFCNVRIVPPGAKHYGLGSCQVAPIMNSDIWTRAGGEMALFPGFHQLETGDGG